MDSIRSALLALRDALTWMPDSLVAVLILALAGACALGAHKVLRRVLRHTTALRYPFVFALFAQTKGVSRLGLLILAMIVVLPVVPLDKDAAAVIARALLIGIIALAGWASMIALKIGADIYLSRFRLDAADNLLARKHTTQIRVLLRVADILVALVTVAAALMTFESVRQYGVSLFASAGIAGIVAGLAARPVLSNLFAGVQLAMTQPIRIDDAVIVENEWGWIEEITATYVVVRLWDWRRMVVPLTYFIEKPFQNWTREGSALIGSVYLYLDYAAPVAAIRAKLKEIAEHSALWDGKVVNLQVSDARDHTIEVRALVSASSAPAAWDLRCEVREKLIAFLQAEHPEALPRTRAQLSRNTRASAGKDDDSRPGDEVAARQRARGAPAH
jgi:small-conductance mechanosensitive channel